MKVDRVILLGMMDNYHKLASAGEKLAYCLIERTMKPDTAYDTARTLASFGQYMLDALDQAEAWGYAEWAARMQRLLDATRS
jgi:hypothetical protein